MSWDIFVQDMPPSIVSPADIPRDFVPAALGQRTEIIRKICEVVPFANFTDPAWGLIDGPGFSIEVNLGDAPIVQGFAFHVRGGNTAAAVISDILAHMGFRAFDTASESGMFEPGAAAEESMSRWRTYKDSVLPR
ncbi:hypothetical protein ACFPN2_10270 [Steroidobacter flavus]|uniref:Uncharacterized protein n=1 Tax=Steroidobacter flavus TaxID=1842136 RepID=A0ABV8SRZ5_9GAMM